MHTYYRHILQLVMFCFLSCGTLRAQEKKGVDSAEIKAYFFEGLKEKHKENYAGAAWYLEKYLSSIPADDAALYELSAVQLKIGNYVDAERNISRAISRRKDNAWYYKLKADILLATNNLSQLVSVYDELVNLEPDNSKHYLDKAKALYMASRMDEVKKVYATFKERFGDRMELREAQKNLTIETIPVEMDIESLKQLINKDPRNYRNYLDLANLYLQEGMADEALAILEQSEVSNGSRFELLLGKAVVYRMLREPDLALQNVLRAFRSSEMEFERKYHFVQQLIAEFEMVINKNNLLKLSETIIEEHPAEPRAYYIDGEVLMKTGKIYPASKRYAESLRFNDQNFVVWERLISIHASQRDYPMLLETVNNALSTFPNQPFLIYYRELARNRLNMKASKSELEYAVTLAPENRLLVSCIYGLMAEIDYAQGKLSDAGQWFTKALQWYPDNVRLLNTYGYFLAERGVAFDFAQGLLKKAVELQADNSGYLYSYSYLLYKMGNLEEAKVNILNALQHADKENPIYLEHYGDILNQMGFKEDARVKWKMAQSLGRASEKLKEKLNE